MDVDPLIVASFNTGQELYDWAIENNVLDNYFVQERLTQFSFRIPDTTGTQSQTTNQPPLPTLPDSPALVVNADQQSPEDDNPATPDSCASGSSGSSELFDIEKIKQDVRQAKEGGKTHQCPRRCGAKFKTYQELVNHRDQCQGRQNTKAPAASAEPSPEEVYNCKV